MTEDAFLDAIRESPTDETTRLVYADWLEDAGDPRAEFLRVECEFLALPAEDSRARLLHARIDELYVALDADWLSEVARVPRSALAELRRVLPPPRRPYQAEGDWDAVEAALGTRLPADYKAFIGVYGSGAVNHCLDIASPWALGSDIRRRWEEWASCYDDWLPYRDVPYPRFPQPGGLLPFGTLGDVHTLNWRTIGGPDQWVFVYHSFEEGFVEIKGLSAVEFVLEVVTQRSPFAGRLWGETTFQPPCHFYPHRPDPRTIQLSNPRRMDLEEVAHQLAARWLANDLLVFRPEEAITLIVEPIWGYIRLSHEGGPRTWCWIHFDQSCLGRVEDIRRDLLALGFTPV